MRCWLLILCCLATTVSAKSVRVNDLRVWTAPERTRLVFDLSGAVDHTIFTLPNPNRVVIDLKKARLKHKIRRVKSNESFIQGIRSGVQQQRNLRIVLDLKKKARVRSFLLKPNKKYGHRLVVDIRERTSQAVKITQKRTKITQLRDVVIAIDAGHGGEDPGALGKRGTKEKDVVLAIAKKLKVLIDRSRGMQAVLVRSGDYYVKLRDRMSVARKHSADLFISIHADAFRQSTVHGSSVFVLSERGASSEAAHWLAERENGADMVGGVSLSQKDDMLAKILMDLSQTATNEVSHGIATKILSGLKRLGKVHKSTVQHAGFQVLKSPDIPSLLVETAFITNAKEERKLNSARYQSQVARAIFKGVRRYYADKPPRDTLLAARKHTVEKGDTLGGIALHYGIGVKHLRQLNRLKSDRLLIGRELLIPLGS